VWNRRGIAEFSKGACRDAAYLLVAVTKQSDEIVGCPDLPDRAKQLGCAGSSDGAAPPCSPASGLDHSALVEECDEGGPVGAAKLAEQRDRQILELVAR
jgi:hypothetical protein